MQQMKQQLLQMKMDTILFISKQKMVLLFMVYTKNQLHTELNSVLLMKLLQLVLIWLQQHLQKMENSLLLQDMEQKHFHQVELLILMQFHL
mmetsp:Transcript_8860/g.25280  ORF Transcript_8860/g.25280 Transcript_8860/m.25280 type:complete len:91 (+) Transcript_8860:942-1214(+)